MKYLYIIIFTATLVVLQLVATGYMEGSMEAPREGVRFAGYQEPARVAARLPRANLGTEVSEKP